MPGPACHKERVPTAVAGGAVVELNHKWLMLDRGANAVPVKVAMLNEEQLMVCSVGVIIMLGAVVLIPMAKILVAEQLVTGSIATQVSVMGWVKLTVPPVALNDKLVQV